LLLGVQILNFLTHGGAGAGDGLIILTNRGSVYPSHRRARGRGNG
jgi:hypothetical protein